MNHAYNLTIEQELTNKTSFSIAYVGTAGRELVNWHDLNACPVSTDPCAGSSINRQPFTARFPNPDPTVVGGLYNHILQLNNDAFSTPESNLHSNYCQSRNARLSHETLAIRATWHAEALA